MAAGNLVSIAAELGSDVPFLVTGGGALAPDGAMEITMLPDLPAIDVLVVAPAETIPAKTPSLYRALTPDDFSDGRHTKRLAEGLTIPSVDHEPLPERFRASGQSNLSRPGRRMG